MEAAGRGASTTDGAHHTPPKMEEPSKGQLSPGEQDHPSTTLPTPSPSPPILNAGNSEPGATHTPVSSQPTGSLNAVQQGRMLPPGASYLLKGQAAGLESVPEAPGSSGSSNGQDSRPHQQWEQMQGGKGTAAAAPQNRNSNGSTSSRPPLPTPPLRESLAPILTSATSPSASSAQRQSSSSPTTSRPSGPLPVPPTETASPNLGSSSRRGTDASIDADYALPLQFSPIPSTVDARKPVDDSARGRDRDISPVYGIPGGRLMASEARGASGSTARASTASLRSSTIPSFIPAPAFSANDRGPYPPHTSPNLRPESMAYFGSMDKSYSGMANGKGKAREDESELLASGNGQRGSGAYGDPAAQQNPEGRPSFELPNDLSQSMVGVGRNSIIRNSLSPPHPQHQLLGPAPTSPTGPGSPSSPSIGQQQYAPPQQQYSGPRPLMNGGQLPPHLIPQPEICVECMMRDRDMADVDVVGEGIWDRESDAEFEEAMRWDADEGGPGTASGDHRGGGSEESAGGTRSTPRRSLERGTGGSRESAGGRSSVYGAPPRKRIGRGQPLTTPSLKLWTSMNPPASAHRWRTLQGYLQSQIHLIELERQAREAATAERDRASAARVADRQSAPPFLGAVVNGRSRSSTLLPQGLTVEEDRPNKLRAKSKTRTQDESQRGSTISLQPYPAPQPPFASSSASVRSYSYGDQPWLNSSSRRFSSPGAKDPNGLTTPSSSSSSIKGFNFGKFARSSTDLRSIGSPRSISPARTSLGVDERRGSVWSKFRQSASQSVLSFAPSFAPSGSMMDMHLGLSTDKHMSYGAPYETYPSTMSDPAVARHVEKEQRDRALEGERASVAAKPKKKGVKGFFSKLVGGGGSKKRVSSSSAPTTPRVPLDFEDERELAPPPPLSALANEPRYHGRSPSNSSVDSFTGPYTPPAQQPSHFRLSSGQPLHNDRASVLSFNSGLSKQRNSTILNQSAPPAGQRFSQDSLNAGVPRSSSPEPYLDDREVLDLPLADSTNNNLSTAGPGPPRHQKSLPLLPTEAPMDDERDSYPFPPPSGPYASMQGSQSASSFRMSYDDGEDGSWGRARGKSAQKQINPRKSRIFSFAGSLSSKSSKKKQEVDPRWD